MAHHILEAQILSLILLNLSWGKSSHWGIRTRAHFLLSSNGGLGFDN